MVDKREISKDLTEAFVDYQYRLDHPMPAPMETKEMIVLKYRNDPIFHAKVKHLVAGVMHILEKHI